MKDGLPFPLLLTFLWSYRGICMFTVMRYAVLVMLDHAGIRKGCTIKHQQSPLPLFFYRSHDWLWLDWWWFKLFGVFFADCSYQQIHLYSVIYNENTCQSMVGLCGPPVFLLGCWQLCVVVNELKEYFSFNHLKVKVSQPGENLASPCMTRCWCIIYLQTKLTIPLHTDTLFLAVKGFSYDGNISFFPHSWWGPWKYKGTTFFLFLYFWGEVVVKTDWI